MFPLVLDLGDLALLITACTGGVAALVTALVAAWKVLREVRAMRIAQDEQGLQQTEIHHQVMPNTGTSMVDALSRVEDSHKHLAAQFDDFNRSHVRLEDSVMAMADRTTYGLDEVRSGIQQLRTDAQITRDIAIDNRERIVVAETVLGIPPHAPQHPPRRPTHQEE